MPQPAAIEELLNEIRFLRRQLDAVNRELEEIKRITLNGWRPWMPLKEAAEYAGLSPKTLRKLLDEEGITYKVARGKIIVNRQSLDEYLESDAQIAKLITHRLP